MLGSTFDPHTTLIDRNGGVKEYFQVAEALGGSTSEAHQLVMLVENRRVDAVNAAVLHALARAREDGLNEGFEHHRRSHRTRKLHNHGSGVNLRYTKTLHW